MLGYHIMYIRSRRSGNHILPGKPLAKCYFVAPRHKIRDVQFVQVRKVLLGQKCYVLIKNTLYSDSIGERHDVSKIFTHGCHIGYITDFHVQYLRSHA